MRGVRALYLGLPINCVIIGWVNLAMAKILSVTMGWDRLTAVIIGLGMTGVYAALAGLRGVVVTDFFQFALALFGTIAIAWFALRVPEVGGIAGLRDKLPESTFQLMPELSNTGSDASHTLALPFAAFIAYIGIQWWASWYPGQEPGGGGYVAQRMMSARDERHAFLATLWFTVAHYCLRPWPWILVALATLVLYPNIPDREAGYAMVLRDYLPPGWRGLLLGAFFAAYMSTTSTQLNWGTSYVVNDFYRRFVQREASEMHYVGVSRITTLIIMAMSALVMYYLETIRQAWEFMLESGAGVGLVLMLRWYWWRVNAWSEIAAIVAPVLGYGYVKLFTNLQFPETLIYLVAWTTLCWLLVTFLTPPVPEAHLVAFYRRVRPGGPGWKRVAAAAGEPPPEPIAGLVVDWMAGCVLVYSMLFSLGTLVLGSLSGALTYLAGAAVALVVICRNLTRQAN